MACCCSNRTLTSVYGWIELISTLLTLSLAGLIWYGIYKLAASGWKAEDGSMILTIIVMAFLTINQFTQLCTSMALIKGAAIDTPPAKSIRLIEFWGRVTVALIVINFVTGLYYYYILFCLPFNILYFVVAQRFLPELKELRDRDAANSDNQTTRHEGQNGMDANDYAILRAICLC